MKTIPNVSKYMTTCPQTIASGQSLSQAGRLMNDLRIRHLPMTEEGKLVGIISERDVRLVSSFAGFDAEKTKVAQAFAPNPYVTSPEAPLSEVCAQMAIHKYGCAIICDHDKLVGIFTWVDALNALNELLSTRLKN